MSKPIKARANYERGSLALHLHVYLESESIATFIIMGGHVLPAARSKPYI